MSRILLALVAVVVVVTAMFMRSPVARAQGTTGFQYVRVAPYVVQIPVGPNNVQERLGYRACVAGLSEWTCRDFRPTLSTTDADALRPVLVTLGNEGWELVSVVAEAPGTPGLTYLFKRPAR